MQVICYLCRESADDGACTRVLVDNQTIYAHDVCAKKAFEDVKELAYTKEHIEFFVHEEHLVNEQGKRAGLDPNLAPGELARVMADEILELRTALGALAAIADSTTNETIQAKIDRARELSKGSR